MLDLLKFVVKNEFPKLLEDKKRWKSLNITYHPPRVERLWTQYGEFRIFLHTIFPCEDGEALWHPHVWPSATHVLDGKYEMGIASYNHDAYLDLWSRSKESAKIIVGPGSSYEMTDPTGCHYVRPIEGPVRTIMVIGSPFAYNIPAEIEPAIKQLPLNPRKFNQVFHSWKDRLSKGI